MVKHVRKVIKEQVCEATKGTYKGHVEAWRGVNRFLLLLWKKRTVLFPGQQPAGNTLTDYFPSCGVPTFRLHDGTAHRVKSPDTDALPVNKTLVTLCLREALFHLSEPHGFRGGGGGSEPEWKRENQR